MNYDGARPEYELWFVPEFPLADIDHSWTEKPRWQWRNRNSLDLLENDIKRQGLVNPLIVRFRPECGDSSPGMSVGGGRLYVLKTRLKWTHAPVLVCGSGGRLYKDLPGTKQYSWDDDELHALFKDGVLGVNSNTLCMAQCCDRDKGEVPGPGVNGTYREACSTTLYVPSHHKHPVKVKGLTRHKQPMKPFDYTGMPEDYKIPPKQ